MNSSDAGSGSAAVNTPAALASMPIPVTYSSRNPVVVVGVARAGQLKSSGERLSDRVAVGVLTQAFPQPLVNEVLAETGRVQQRNRLLPARLAVQGLRKFPGLPNWREDAAGWGG
ncbi:transposase domain-containing protein [Streptomyces sp. NPDC001635]